MTTVRLTHRGRTREVRIEKGTAVLDGRPVALETDERGGRLERLVVDGSFHRIVTARDGDRVLVWCEGVAFGFERVRGSRTAPGTEHAGDLLSPMPGRVRKIFARAGSRVARGELLLVLEAMKMEHSVRAPREGVVKRLLVEEGDLVEAGAELAQIG